MKWLVDFNAGKTHVFLFYLSNSIGAIDVLLDGSVLKRASSFKILGLTFSFKLDWGFTLSLLRKLPPRKVESSSVL